ncbi:MAG: pyruvate kinase [Candidatus Competibacteraceae bacterium]
MAHRCRDVIGETAAGSYPVQAVQAMARICLGAERQRNAALSDHRILAFRQCRRSHRHGDHVYR